MNKHLDVADRKRVRIAFRNWGFDLRSTFEVVLITIISSIVHGRWSMTVSSLVMRKVLLRLVGAAAALVEAGALKQSRSRSRVLVNPSEDFPEFFI